MPPRRVELTIVVVLVVIHVRAEVNMIDPDLAGLLDTDVVDGSQTFGDLEVTDDDVLRVKYTETDTSEG